MRITKCLFGILVLLLLLSPSLSALDFVYPAKVERVIDGDTIVVDLQLGLGVVLDDQYIRFYGIDAWETRGEEKEKGLEAKKYLEERLKEGNIEIEIRPEWGQNGKGKYGRWLGIVYVEGIDINAEMIEKKHAVKYEEGEEKQ
ncbi:hypothetical protein ES702_05271 [subsurface metagenome]